MPLKQTYSKRVRAADYELAAAANNNPTERVHAQKFQAHDASKRAIEKGTTKRKAGEGEVDRC